MGSLQVTLASLVCNKKDNIDLLLKPIKDDNIIDETYISELITASEYTNLYINTANIKNALAELSDVLKPLKENETGHDISYQILERKDATITIEIDKDEMSASAEITKALGGKNLTAKAILTAAQESGVRKGFSKESLLKLAHLAIKESSTAPVSLSIASGKLAKDGKDAYIKHLVESAQSRILRPKKRKDGSVDMRDLGDIICVKVGDPIAQKVPLTSGRDGFTVTATPLLPEPGNDVSLISGEGTEISPKNENILVSTLVGLPKIIDNGMEIDEVYKIKNVTVATGNIKFTGSVLIDGDVMEGMKVQASGDITIGGFVESAIIEAGGDITISGGIIGRKQEANENNKIKNSVNITAGGNIYAKYCQYAQINCSKDVRIEKQLLHSYLNIKGKLKVGTDELSNGKLIGGYVKVVKSISAGIIGATAGSNTIINFEYQLLKFTKLMKSIDERLKIDSDKTDKLKISLSKLKRLPKEKSNLEMITKVTKAYQLHAKKMGDILLEKEALEEDIQNYMSSIYVEATEKLYHGVELIIGKFNNRSRREYGPSKMIYKEREVLIDPLIHNQSSDNLENIENPE